MTSLFDPTILSGHYQPKIDMYYYRQWDNYCMPFHRHLGVEIMYMMKGECVVETREQAFSLKNSELILLDSLVDHRLVVEKGVCRMLNVEFILTEQGSHLHSIRALGEADPSLHSFLRNKRDHLILKDTSDVSHILKSLVLELDSKQKDNEAMVQLLLSQLLIRIGRLAGEAEASQKPQADIYINQATSYIHHHYDCEIQVKDIASAVNLHPGYLQRIFKASMGCTLVEYLTRLRIEKAKMLLTQTDIPVIEISQNVGFNNRQHFSSIFKKITSQSPGQYRKSVHVMSKHQYRLPLTDK